MTLYMAQFAYTSEAWTAFTKHPEDRTTIIEALAKKLGCQFEALYYSLGEYDGFVIFDAPDEATVTAFVLGSDRSRSYPRNEDNSADVPRAMFDAMKKASLADTREPRSSWAGRRPTCGPTGKSNRAWPGSSDGEDDEHDQLRCASNSPQMAIVGNEKGQRPSNFQGAFKSGAGRWLAASNNTWQNQIVRNNYTTSWWAKKRAWVKPFLEPQSSTKSSNVEDFPR